MLNHRIDCNMIGGVIVDLVSGDIVEYAVLYDDTGRMSTKRHVGVDSCTARGWGESKAKVDSDVVFRLIAFVLCAGSPTRSLNVV